MASAVQNALVDVAFRLESLKVGHIPALHLERLAADRVGTLPLSNSNLADASACVVTRSYIAGRTERAGAQRRWAVRPALGHQANAARAGGFVAAPGSDSSIASC